jgi:hypothetical protein
MAKDMALPVGIVRAIAQKVSATSVGLNHRTKKCLEYFMWTAI